MFERLITWQARQRPHATAILTPAGGVTFAGLDADVNRMARRLRPVLPEGRGVVAVQTQNPGLHWVVLLALARLGRPSASLPPVTERPRELLLALLKPALLLSDGEADGPAPAFHLSPDWLAETFRASSDPVAPAGFAPEDPARVILSSGTTGTPKLVVWSARVLDRRIQTGALISALAGARSYIHEGVDTDGGFRGPLLVWAAGGSITYARPGAGWVEVLTTLQPQSIAMVPAQLSALLDALPQGFAPAPDLNVLVGGSPLPQALGRRVRLHLTPNLFVTYGSTEAGLITMAPAHRVDGRAGAAGFVNPWAEVEVVDEDDRAVAPGETGRVRMRSEEMVAGYEGDPALTASAFRDGWFYPGDVGALAQDGCLILQGRVSEVMDLGGVKLAPLPVEEAALEVTGVADCAAVAVEGADGFHRGVLAVRRGPGFDGPALEAALVRQFPQVRFRVVAVEAIPRSVRGKIQREETRTLVRAALAPAG